jgi:hypothetical protein
MINNRNKEIVRLPKGPVRVSEMDILECIKRTIAYYDSIGDQWVALAMRRLWMEVNQSRKRK